MKKLKIDQINESQANVYLYDTTQTDSKLIGHIEKINEHEREKFIAAKPGWIMDKDFDSFKSAVEYFEEKNDIDSKTSINHFDKVQKKFSIY